MGDLVRRRASVLLVLGCVLLVVGLLGLVFDWGASSSTAQPRAVGGASSASNATSSSSSAGSSAAPTSTASAAETAGSFFDAFTTAIRSSDRAFLSGHMHSVVIDRYGVDQCSEFAASLIDPSIDLHLVSVDGPQAFDYTSDGRSVSVANTFVFHVDGTVSGTAGPRGYHFALVDGRYRLFVDCGDPIN